MPRKGSIVRSVRQTFSGVSAKDAAIVGGTIIGAAGAVALGYVLIQNLSGQTTVNVYTKLYGDLMKDYLDELHQFTTQNGNGDLTPSQRSALAQKVVLMKQISDAATQAAAQGQMGYTQWIEAAFGVAVLAVGLKWGPNALRGFLDAVKGRGTPQTPQSYVQLFEGSEAVGLAIAGDLSLATAFYNGTMATDQLAMLMQLQLEQTVLNASIANLSGLALATAQLQLSAITADIFLEPIIYSLPPGFF